MEGYYKNGSLGTGMWGMDWINVAVRVSGCCECGDKRFSCI